MSEPRWDEGEQVLVFTDAAAQKVGQLIEREGNPELKLRVYIQGGGCSGFQYGFTFDEEVQDGDTSVENAGVTLLVDPKSTSRKTCPVRSSSFVTPMRPQPAGAALHFPSDGPDHTRD